MTTHNINVNGTSHTIEAEPDTPLLYILRDHLALSGAKFGCGLGQCGSCTVMVGGKAVYSCLMPVSVVGRRPVKTVEGLGTAERPGVLQQAFIEEQAAQCGYCIAGMIMRAQVLLERQPPPNDAEIRRHMAGNLCRCGTHMRILRAVHRALDANKTSVGKEDAAAANDTSAARSASPQASEGVAR